MNSPLVTIIVPFYNVERYLKECLDSITEVEGDNYEVLLINDGSTDESSVIASDYVNKYPEKCKLVTQKNMGIACARNTGLENAQGEWIIFVDSDDFVDPVALRTIIERLPKSDVDVLIYDAQKYVNGTGKILEMSRRPNPFYEKGVVNAYSYMKTLIECKLLNFVTVWDKAYKKETLTKLNSRFIPGRIHEDVAFIFQLFLNDIDVEFVDTKVVYYRISREGSIMTSYSKAKLAHVIENIKTLREELIARKVTDTILFDYLVFLAGTVVKSGYKAPTKLLAQLFLAPLSLRKRVILSVLIIKNLFTKN